MDLSRTAVTGAYGAEREKLRKSVWRSTGDSQERGTRDADCSYF